MPFTYQRVVRFQDTDAAGVVYFANGLAMCHEAYEASLAASGMNLKEFFRAGDMIVPIVHASIDFLQPLFCGDAIQVHLTPTLTSDSDFTITYVVLRADRDRPVSIAQTRHVCINAATRKRAAIPEMLQWCDRWRA